MPTSTESIRPRLSNAVPSARSRTSQERCAMAASQGLDAERVAAEQASRDCPYCCGQGIVTVYHPRYSGHPIEVTQDGRRYTAIAAAHCRCEYGVWIRDHLPPEIQARAPRVDDICRGRSDWLLVSPLEDREYPDGPITAESFDWLRGRIKSGRMLRMSAVDPDSPLCPRCGKPMGGGTGGLPWTCFRACKPFPIERTSL